MPAAETTGFRLSPQQRRLWRLTGGDPRYRLEARVAVGAGIDPERLRLALAAVVEDHEILRTAFVEVPGLELPVQAPRDAGLDWRRIELAGDGPASLDQVRAAERAEPLDLRSGRPLRAIWVEGGGDRPRLLLSLSGLCADARTLDNLIAAVAAVYGGAREEAEGIPYVQFSEWQNGLLEDEDAAEGLDFWRRSASARERWPRLPFSPPAAGGDGEGTGPVAAVRRPVAAELAEAMERIAARCGTGPAEAWLAAWSLLLARLGGASEVAVADVAEGREHPVLEGALGALARSVPVALACPPHLRFDDLVKGAAEARAEARQWADYYAPDSGARHPVGFAYRGVRRRWPVGDGELVVEQRALFAGTAALDLHVERSEDGLAVELQRDPAELSERDAERLLDYLVNLVRSAAREPATAVRALPLLGDHERLRLVEELNRTEAEPPADDCLHRWFARTARERPDATAAVYRDHSLSYGELDRRSDRLAGHLRARGVGPEVAVGLLMDRSVDALAAILGVWKAGGVYVPLSPTQPEDGLRFLLRDSGVELVLTERRLEAILESHDVARLALDRSWPGSAPPAAGAPPAAVTGDHLAYVVYTSGSTGRPKGVMVRHGSLVNLAEALRRALYAESGVERVSLNAPLTFDASIKQVLALALGITVDVVPEEVRSQADATLRHLAAHAVDGFDCTPSQLRLLLDAGWRAPAARRPRLVLVGGEAIDAALWRSLRATPATAWINLYGPTECTVDVTSCRVDGERTAPAIGRPLANVRTYVVDRWLQPVPAGVVGELCVAGRGLARGYLGRPSLTAAAFAPDPFGAPGERLYRTGDLARHLADGAIDLLGRLDHQVKIQGYRIEPGEIEHALRRHPEVRDAVVTVRRDGDGDGERHLAAYYTAAPRAAVTAADLREELRRRLPEHMVPALLVRLPELPLTRNGKVDRAALPDPAEQPAERSAEYHPPENEIQQAIAEVWQQELELPRVGVRDNFFDLGGHSLLMARVHARLRERFERDISMIEMFRHPTVELLAALVSGRAPSVDDRLDQALERAELRRRRRSRSA